MKNIKHRKFYNFFKNIGVVPTSIVLTIVASLISVGTAIIVLTMINIEIRPYSIILSTVIPVIIVPLFSVLILRLTFQLGEAQEKLHMLSITDDLTGVKNRRYFSEVATQECARAKRYGIEFAILMFDIDGFKQINDTFGHMVGDEVLQAVSRVCQNVIRQTDVFARWGGDEFIILVRQSAEVNLMAMVERIKAEFRQNILVINGEKIQITISIGGQRSEEGCEDFNKIISRADKALYAAKEKGVNRFVMGGENN